MKIQFIFTVSVALLQAAPTLSAGVRNGHLATDFDEYLQRARSNSSKKQCKKNCERTYTVNTAAYNQCEQDCASAYDGWNYFPTGGQCKKRCKKNSDCQLGGFNPCGECGQYVGTEMYQLCYAPKPNPEEDMVAEVEEDSLDNSGGSGYCGSKCWTDSDCPEACGFCNDVFGSDGFHTCITFDPIHFPDGGQCKKTCKKDVECQVDGLNPCGSCGTVGSPAGTFRRCYAPESAFDE